MKARIVLVALLVSIMVVEVSAQRAEYDDMYFRGKDREKNKAIDAEESLYASAKITKAKQDDFVSQEEDNTNPTDSYSARNVNPEYVSRSNSEKASEDESNYYLEGYNPAPASSQNYNNSYYGNASNIPSSNFYGGSNWNNHFLNRSSYGCSYCSPQMSYMITSAPFYPYGHMDGWMTPYYGSSGWNVSFMYSNYYGGGYGYGNPYYGGYGNPYYGGYGNYSNYYGGNTSYNEPPRVVNYGKRPSRNSAIITPTTRPSRENGSSTPDNATVSTGRTTRTREAQEDYYVRPSRRTSVSGFDNSRQRSGSGNSFWTPSNNNNSSNNNASQPTRSHETYSPPTRSSYSPSSSPSYSPSSSPSSSPSRGNSGGSSGGGSSPRPRGGRD